MATHPAVRRWTYEEFAALPDDGNRYEVIAGDLYMTPAPRMPHQEIVSELLARLRTFASEHRLGKVYAGPVDVLFAEGDYLEPDLVFVREDRRRDIVKDRGIEGAPDLVVEVLSASTASRDRGLKRQRYAWFGVPEYWVVDADAKQIEVYRLNEAPRVERERLVWSPIAGGPELVIPVQDVLESD